jgi:hypothetical protein
VLPYSERDLTQEPWRSNKETDYQNFLTWIRTNYQERRALGVKKYGTVFQGRPLQHAADELFDALFYIYKEMERQSFIA